MITASFFKNVWNSRPMVADDISGFAELVDFLTEDIPEVDPERKLGQPCVSPAAYPVEARRSKESAFSWDWFAADIDNEFGNMPGSTIDDIIGVMDQWASPYLIYSTASYQPDAQCFRLMFPLDRAIQASEFEVVWKSFSLMLPMDKVTKDISRIFIMPRRWKGREHRLERSLAGKPICVDEVLQRFPVPKSQPTKQPPTPTVITKSTSSAPGIIVPASLKAPFVPLNAVEEAMMAQVGGRMYRFLVTVAFSALRQRYIIAAHDLEQIGHELARLLGRDTSDIARDATRALAFAETRHRDSLADRAAQRRSILLPRSMR